MFKRCRPVGMLMLALTGLINQSKADPLARFDIWIKMQPNRPGTKENPDNSVAGYLKFIKQVAESPDFKEGRSVYLDDQAVAEFVKAIADLSVDQICSRKNLGYAAKAKKIIDQLVRDPNPFVRRPLEVILGKYFHAVRNCYTELIAPLQSPEICDELDDVFLAKPLRFIDEIDNHISEPSFFSDTDPRHTGESEQDYSEFERFIEALTRQRCPNAMIRDGRNLLEMLRQAWPEVDSKVKRRHGDGRFFYDQDRIEVAIDRHLIGPCTVFVGRRDALLGPIETLGSMFDDLKYHFRDSPRMCALRMASRFVNCKTLLAAMNDPEYLKASARRVLFAMRDEDLEN